MKTEGSELEAAPGLDVRDDLAGEVRQVAAILGARIDQQGGEIASLRKEISSLKAEISSLKKVPSGVPRHDHNYASPSALAGFVSREEWAKWGSGVVEGLNAVRQEVAALKNHALPGEVAQVREGLKKLVAEIGKVSGQAQGQFRVWAERVEALERVAHRHRKGVW